jgi:hypothetical protein
VIIEDLNNRVLTTEINLSQTWDCFMWWIWTMTINQFGSRVSNVILSNVEEKNPTIVALIGISLMLSHWNYFCTAETNLLKDTW